MTLASFSGPRRFSNSHGSTISPKEKSKRIRQPPTKGNLSERLLRQRKNNLESRREPPSILDSTSSRVAGVSVARISWHGWADSFLIRNGLIEAVVVPSIGRVMQMRPLDDPAGAFWRNAALDGLIHEPPADPSLPREWRNYGGDKCWPAPQSAWPKVQGRAWPPPDAFDSQPMNAVATESSVTLTSAVDRSFGIQIVRHVELDPGRPVMRIQTQLRKRAGAPVKVGIWTITQLQDPECVAILLPSQSKFANGYTHLLSAQPAGLTIDGAILSLARHPHELVKIRSDQEPALPG